MSMNFPKIFSAGHVQMFPVVRRWWICNVSLIRYPVRYRSGSHNLKTLCMTKDILITLNIQMGIKTMAMAGGIQENLEKESIVPIN